MKKLIAKIIAAPLVMLAVCPALSAYAADEQHELYLSAEGAELTDTGAVFRLDRSVLEEGDYTLRIDIFFRDDVLNAWYVSPKVKCADKRIRLCNLTDPKDPLIEFAYAEADENGELISGINSTIASGSEIYNTVNFTCMNSNLMRRSAMVPYGERSDSYALTSFDAVIDKDIEAGEYEIYFLTEHEDEPDQRITEVNLMIEGICDTTLTNMKIIIDEPYTLGDVDNNGLTDANDASAVLKEYSLISTKKDSSLTYTQSKAADVNKDGAINSSDASLILGYYSYKATYGGETDIETYIELRKS